MAAFMQSWSVMVSIESKPFKSGNLTMKPIATVSNGSASGLWEYGCEGGFPHLCVDLVSLAICTPPM
jgi:hypothetical protein